MQAVTGLLVMLLGASHGVETSCDGRQKGAQCNGALGGTVVIQLMDSASEIFRYDWLKQSTKLFQGRKNNITINLLENRSSFTPSNGTIRINDLSRNDSGEYTLTIYNSRGHTLEDRTLQLTIQAPVSSVQLVSECLSQGEQRVSCSSEGGDSPQYSWTLDGHKLTDAQIFSRNNESNVITLKQDVSGQLSCSVRNHISNVWKEEKISTCGFIFIDCDLPNGTHISQWVLQANNTLCIKTTTPQPPTTGTTTTVGKENGITVSITTSTNITSSNQTVTPNSRDEPWSISYLLIMAGVLSALVILLVVGVVYVQKKKQNSNPKEKEDEQELTYADVRVVKRERRQMQQKAEEEVEYGQVKFSQPPPQTVQPTGDECVYAKVRRGR